MGFTSRAHYHNYQAKVEYDLQCWRIKRGYPTLFKLKFPNKCKCPDCDMKPDGWIMRKGDVAGYHQGILMSEGCIGKILDRRWECPDCHNTNILRDELGYVRMVFWDEATNTTREICREEYRTLSSDPSGECFELECKHPNKPTF